MPYIHFSDKKILYMHVPKAGGTTVEDWLNSFAPLQLSAIYNLGWTPTTRCTPQHFTAFDIQRLFQKSYFDYSFLFIRCPYKKLESEYRWQVANTQYVKNKPMDETWRIPTLKREFKDCWLLPSTFSRWVKNSIIESKKNPWLHDNHLRPQLEFFYPGSDCFKIEDGILTGLQKVALKTGLPTPESIPVLNNTKDVNVKTEWTDEARELVAKHYACDFKEFGYKT